MPSIRVLVVEDYAPFLEGICSTLRKESSLQIVGTVSDGLEAVSQAEELKPDLILLDIGLPTLNGFEAARQIRKVAPESKIVFLTQESSADVAQEALNLGARGYVVKMRPADLLAAVDAVLEDKQFVSSGLSSRDFTDTSRVFVEQLLQNPDFTRNRRVTSVNALISPFIVMLIGVATGSKAVHFPGS